MLPPAVAVAGAGPAGLLVALLLSRHGLSVDVFDECELLTAGWTPRSYSINLNARGYASEHKDTILYTFVNARVCAFSDETQIITPSFVIRLYNQRHSSRAQQA